MKSLFYLEVGTQFMNNIIIKKATSTNQLKDVLDIRFEVFIIEQNISRSEEFEKDNYLFNHYILYFNNEPAATARMRKKENTYIVGRVAVLKKYRNLGLGKKIMEFIHQEIKNQQGDTILLHAQLLVKAFYQSLGYTVISDVYYEANIPHITMEKKL